MIISYPLHELSEKEFESLVALICHKILGTGTIIFSTGKDGGRDAKFTGTAQHFPSNNEPWKGKFIIQAKHTENPIAKCSDSDFKQILNYEVDNKLKTLKENGEVDYYLIFTNRKLSGLTYPKLNSIITNKTKVENEIFGLETIQLHLKLHPEIARILKLDKLLYPLQFYEGDLKELVLKFSQIKNKIIKIIKGKVFDFKAIDLETKNKLNRLSKDYFNFINNNSLANFSSIRSFLEDPINKKYKEYYENTISDLQEVIILKRNDYGNFEELFHVLMNYIIDNNGDLKPKRKLIRVFLHYMYYNCDIGVKE